MSIADTKTAVGLMEQFSMMTHARVRSDRVTNHMEAFFQRMTNEDNIVRYF